jgi:hypothetical protein
MSAVSSEKDNFMRISSIFMGSLVLVIFSMGLQKQTPINSDSRFIVSNVEYSSSKGWVTTISHNIKIYQKDNLYKINDTLFLKK